MKWLFLGVAIAGGALLIVITNTPSTPELPVIAVVATEAVEHLSTHWHTEGDQVADHGHGVLVQAQPLVLEEDTWVEGMRVAVEGAPRVVLHHTNIFVDIPATGGTGRSLLQFPSLVPLSIGQDIEETLTLPAPYAVFLPAGSQIRVSAMLHNPEPPKGPGGDYHDVAVSVSLLGRDREEASVEPVIPISIALIDTDSDHNDSFRVPPRSESYVRLPHDPNDVGRSSYVFPADGTLVALGAHIHAWEGGEKVEVYLNDRRIHTFIPRQGEEAWEWHTKRIRIMQKVKRGDVLSLSATYSNPHDASVLGAMAMVGASYAPEFPLPEGYSLYGHSSLGPR